MKVKFKETGIVVVKACACGEEIRSSVGAVSYTHLTLPTIYSV